MGQGRSKDAGLAYRCKKNHQLVPLLRSYECDQCGVKRDRALALTCKACDYDLCLEHLLSHLGLSANQGFEEYVTSRVHCPKNHLLTLASRAQAWTCDVCNKNHKAGTVSAYCAQCDYDECVAHRVLAPPKGILGPVDSDDVSEPISPDDLRDKRLRELYFSLQNPSAAQPSAFHIPPEIFLALQPRSFTKPSPFSWGISSDMWTKASVYDAPYVSINNDPHSKVVFIQSCKIEASVCHYSARCLVTLTFANTSSQALEGEVTFPLPENAVVSGYALEVNGEMVPASLVESKKAEKVYEAEVKKGVDPGLMQKVAAGGNAFKTRVYPLPAQGTRTLSLVFTMPLDVLSSNTGGFSFSMAFPYPVHCAVDAVVFSQAAPAMDSTLPGCTLVEHEGGGGVYNLHYENASHHDPQAKLRIAVPFPPSNVADIIVEQSSQGDYYFAISDIAPPPKPAAANTDAACIGVIWDASLSREEANVAKELNALSAVLAKLGNPVVDIFIVRNRVEVVTDLSPDKARALLSTTPNDGATSLQSLEDALAPRLNRYSRLLLFSDGQSTMGTGRVPCIEDGAKVPPVYCFTSSPRFNFGHLQNYWALCTGGALFRVDREAIDSIVNAVCTSVAKIFNVWGDSHDTNPSAPESLGTKERFCITGRIKAEAAAQGRATVHVAVGTDMATCEHRVYEISLSNVSSANIVQVLWAQHRIAALEIFEEQNHDAILELGTKFQIVTASTSLLVLETLSQHLEHAIAPHPDRKEMYAQYVACMQDSRRTEQQRVTSKISTVIGYWKSRKDWHDKDFDPTPIPEAKCKKKEMCSDERRQFFDAPCIPQMCPAPPAPSRAMESNCAATFAVDEECADAFASAPRAEKCDVAPSQRATATVKYWSPDTPYLRAIKAASTTPEQYNAYLAQRPEYVKTPAFYFDVAGFFLNPQGLTPERRELGVRVLSNIAELALDNSRVLRVFGYKLYEAKEWELACEVFCRVALWRPGEPQSYRDLGLAFLERGWYQQALELLWHTVIMDVPSSFSEIEVEALWEIRDCLVRASREHVPVQLPPLLQKHSSDFLEGDMSVALRVTMGWDQDNVDLDLHVIEPNGEEAYYGHKLTRMGGLMSRDFTRGYGPESYVLKKAVRGTYRFKTNYFASHMPQLTGPTVAILTISTNFLRHDQRTVCTLIRLNESKDNGEIGSVFVE